MAEKNPPKITINRVIRYFLPDPVILGYKPMTLWVDEIHRYQRSIDAGTEERAQSEIFVWQGNDLNVIEITEDIEALEAKLDEAGCDASWCARIRKEPDEPFY
ncbi:MAG: hypothetical protein JAY90_11500 [Candidatus Thiodiazotropha lotti]|nr:hypothetical protein [Candidatus Thiodiazotropha lotti]